MTDRFHATADGNALDDALDDRRHIHGEDEHDDGNASHGERRLVLVADRGIARQTRQHVRADLGDHHEGHQFHADAESVDQIADREVLGVGRAAETEHDHAGEETDIHLDEHGEKDRRDEREGDDADDHRKRGR